MENYNQNDYYQGNVMPFEATNDLQSVTKKTYSYMFFALIISGLFAFVTYSTGNAKEMLLNGTFYFLIIAEIICVFVTSALISKEKVAPAAIFGTMYCILNGLTLSVIFLAYDMHSIISVFFIAAGLFGIMTIYARVTKKDLTSMGSFLIMALFGLVLVTIVNSFILKSEGLDLILAYVGVFLFLGIAAYDTQMIKKMVQNGHSSENAIALFCALNLYLDFINIFLKLLRIFGKRN